MIERLKAYEAELIENRRHLHSHPEVGFDLPNTHAFVMAKLASYGIEDVKKVGVWSIVATLRNGNGPIIGLRADMDALPLSELNRNLAYCSLNEGKMHACGHDGHTAMLLAAGRFLNDHKDLWKGTVKLIFQEAEEGPDPGGAIGIIRSGAVDDVDAFFALHVSPLHPSKTIAIQSGEAMACADTVYVRLFGKGSHAAYPHLGVDLVLLQADIVQAFQTIVSRRLSPVDHAVVTIAKVHVGTAHNIIAETCELEGTVRAFSNPVRNAIETEMRRILDGMCLAYGARYEFDYVRTYDPTVNTPEIVDQIRKMTVATRGEEAFIKILKPSMGAEDFGRFTQFKKGAMAWLGTSSTDATSYGLHHPLFNLDESALLYGALAHVTFVTNYQEEAK
jgi:amidohydrolase